MVKLWKLEMWRYQNVGHWDPMHGVAIISVNGVLKMGTKMRGHNLDLRAARSETHIRILNSSSAMKRTTKNCRREPPKEDAKSIQSAKSGAICHEVGREYCAIAEHIESKITS